MAGSKCPECGAEAVRARGYTHETMVGGVTVKDATALVEQCEGCGETILTIAQLRGYERRAAALALRQQAGETSAVMRFARKALGKTQGALAELIGCRAETISRWENGAEAVPRSSQLAVVALLEEPENAPRQDGGPVKELEVPPRPTPQKVA